ncbi:hypothetical protein VFPPC_17695 [Pochonia chlamydosporia 170]|uniref:Uncharacterized protein n=1 Tax=Pochonia chlamydosporia 170 TaxID=1380566 RepID=A0A219ARA1_METCM|nr:hypothetical protein VFPPC_17695 [Pochonia chlamydosporia 170]OWT43129.1 hypothetical protein VFPPC_17695 [Pochonia chlamydosporia 170]
MLVLTCVFPALPCSWPIHLPKGSFSQSPESSLVECGFLPSKLFLEPRMQIVPFLFHSFSPTSPSITTVTISTVVPSHRRRPDRQASFETPEANQTSPIANRCHDNQRPSLVQELGAEPKL